MFESLFKHVGKKSGKMKRFGPGRKTRYCRECRKDIALNEKEFKDHKKFVHPRKEG